MGLLDFWTKKVSDKPSMGAVPQPEPAKVTSGIWDTIGSYLKKGADIGMNYLDKKITAGFDRKEDSFSAAYGHAGWGPAYAYPTLPSVSPPVIINPPAGTPEKKSNWLNDFLLLNAFRGTSVSGAPAQKPMILGGNNFDITSVAVIGAVILAVVWITKK